VIADLRPSRGVPALAALLCALASTTAHAADGAAAGPVVIRFENCTDALAATVTELVALELAPRLVARAEDFGAASQDTTEVRFACATDHAAIDVRERDRAAPLTLSLELSQTEPEARPRLMALALAELIVSSRMAASDAAPEPEPEAPTAPAEETLRWTPWLTAGVALQGEPRQPALALQAGLHAGVGPFGGVLDLRVDWARPQLDTARVHSLALSAALSPTLTWHRPHFAWFLSAGVRGGYAHLRGEPDDPTVTGTELHRPWLGPTATTGVHVPFAGPVALRVHVDFTYIATPLRGRDATGQPLYAFEGALLGLMLGIAL